MANMDKIADKIQKLLNLAGNNPNEEEAQAALLKAQALMAEYNVDLESLSGEKKIKYSFEISKVKANPRDNRLNRIIADAFACKPLISANKKLAFFGREDNAKAAKEMMEFLHHTMEQGMRRVCAEYGLKTSESGAAGIYNGYASGFLAGLKAAVDEQTVALAIVVTQDVQDAYVEKFPNIGRYRGRAAEYDHRGTRAYSQGVSDGRSAMGKRSLEA